MPPEVATVLTGGLPAACAGDMATCVGPLDTIAPPGCPTVLMGTGTAAGCATAGGAGSSACESEAGIDSQTEEADDHFLHVDFVDEGGFPVTGIGCALCGRGTVKEVGTFDGTLCKTDLESGSYDIEVCVTSRAAWSVGGAGLGEVVRPQGKCSALESGTPARLPIFMRDLNAPERELRMIETQVDGDRIEGEWTLDVAEDLLPVQEERSVWQGNSAPTFHCIAEASICAARSGSRIFKDWIELQLWDEEGNEVGYEPYCVVCANGQVIEGTLDENGCGKVEDISPGRIRVTVNVRDQNRS